MGIAWNNGFLNWALQSYTHLKGEKNLKHCVPTMFGLSIICKFYSNPLLNKENGNALGCSYLNAYYRVYNLDYFNNMLQSSFF